LTFIKTPEKEKNKSFPPLYFFQPVYFIDLAFFKQIILAK